ncbi:Acg family FMN-binding oxidoreductase [Parafrankia elaeagni]|uniref:Acg family FMN-binding oxidoreductase n=1 Tax=Parafrankia elaeagni TaxID=222534 RepID=UPI00035D07A9|nr:hypothetical protein [Parafrankia elaeagni]
MVDTVVRLTEQDARAIVELAALAPSIHNTQPWRWRLDGTGLHLFADPERLLQVADHEGRQLLISCGAALAFARFAVRSRGLVPEVTYGPLEETGPPTARDPLATITVTGRQPATAAETDLAQAIAVRHTDRRPFLAGERGRLGPDDVSALRRAAETEAAWAWFVEDTDSRITASVLLSRADWQETHDPAYAEELLRWRRDSTTAADGLPAEVVGGVAESRQSEFVLRDFDVARGDTSSVAPSRGTPAGGGAAPAPVEHPVLLAVGTDSDRPVDRLLGGAATGRVLLTATERGLAASPLGQVLDLPALREQLRASFGLAGHVQMLLRVGRPDPDLPPLAATPRRPVDEILDVA